MSTAVISDGTVSIANKLVFKNLTLSIRTGSRTALVGENGSGKTTLLKILLGLGSVSSGQAVPFVSDTIRTSYIPQDYRNALLPWLNLRTNVKLALSSSRAASDTAFICTARQFKMEFNLNKYPTQLSGGEQQVFLLARALLAGPSFLVLDEPFSAIDYGRRQLVRDFLAQSIVEHGITTVISSHDFDDAVLMANQVIVLSKRTLGIQTIIDVPLPWPRHPGVRQTDAYRDTLNAVSNAVLTS